MRRSAFVLVLLAACKHAPPPPAPVVSAAMLCSDPRYDSHLDPKTAEEVMVRVAVEGYLDIPRGMVTLCSDKTCPAVLLPAPGATDKGLSISLDLGDGPAEMKQLPDHFTEHDLVVHTTDGKTVGAGAKVRVSGKQLGSVKEHSGQLVDVDRIDAL